VRYRYYVCQALLQNQSDKAGALKRVPAEEIEELVLKKVGELFEHPNRLIDHLGVSDGEEKHRFIQAAAALATKMKQDGDKALLAFARRIVKGIVAGPDKVQINIGTAVLKEQLGMTIDGTCLGPAQSSGTQDDSEFSVTVPVRLTRSGRQKSMIAMDKDNSYRLVNDNMLIAIARAMKWDQEMRSGAALAALAKRDGLSTGYATSIMPLAFLAPDIVRTIHEGRQPAGLTIKALVAQLPIDWSEQRRVLGFPAPVR
jgi:hypothetical protein